MEINKLLSKPSWRRRIPAKKMVQKSRAKSTVMALGLDSPNYIYLSQADFMDELVPSSHMINSCEYRSNRPLYKWNEAEKKNEFNGFEEVERVAVGMQSAIRRHKVTHTFGNEIEFRNVGDSNDAKRLKDKLVLWDMAGMKDSLMSWANGFYGTGDSAIYLYRDGGKIKYKVFSFENDDLINQVGDKFIRLFKVADKKVTEIYDSNNISVWVGEEDKADAELMAALGIKKPEQIDKSVDGWVCVSRSPHGLTQNPVIYHRESDVCWGVGQSMIERLERILSDLAENNRYFAYQILFLTGGVMTLPDTKFQGKVMASKSKDGKAEILKPADASDSFTIDLEKTLELLFETTGTTVINIEDLKGGDQSGAYIINLYFRAVQWATDKISQLRPDIDRVVSVFNEFCGLIHNDVTGYMNMKEAWSLSPFVPKNKMEEITMLGLQVNSGFMSRETAAEISPDTSVDEMERLGRQEEKEAAKEAAEVSAAQPKLPSTEVIDRTDNKAK